MLTAVPPLDRKGTCFGFEQGSKVCSRNKFHWSFRLVRQGRSNLNCSSCLSRFGVARQSAASIVAAHRSILTCTVSLQLALLSCSGASSLEKSIFHPIKPLLSA